MFGKVVFGVREATKDRGKWRIVVNSNDLVSLMGTIIDEGYIKLGKLVFQGSLMVFVI